MNDRSTTLSSTHLHNLPVRSRSYWRQRARRPAAGSCTVLSSRRPPRCPARRLPRPRARPLPHQTPGPFSFLPPVGTLLNAAVLGPDRCAASQDAAPYLLQRQVLRRQRLRVPVRARAAPTPSPRGRHLARSSAARAAQDLPAQTQRAAAALQARHLAEGHREEDPEEQVAGGDWCVLPGPLSTHASASGSRVLILCCSSPTAEWRGLGVQQSRGWVHYAIHRPEPHILLMRRPRTDGASPTIRASEQLPGSAP